MYTITYEQRNQKTKCTEERHLAQTDSYTEAVRIAMLGIGLGCHTIIRSAKTRTDVYKTYVMKDYSLDHGGKFHNPKRPQNLVLKMVLWLLTQRA